MLLSDHGQSFGATFKQRYGMDLKEFIEQQLPQGATVAQSIGGDTGGPPGLGAISASWQTCSSRGGRRGRAKLVAKQDAEADRAGSPRAQDAQDAQKRQPGSVTAYGSGNIAQVYFDLYPRKITLSELDAAYPGMVDALVQHEGIGLVVGYAGRWRAVVLGKGGQRNLHTRRGDRRRSAAALRAGVTPAPTAQASTRKRASGRCAG